MKSKINKIFFTSLSMLLFAAPAYGAFVFCGTRAAGDEPCTINDLWVLVFYAVNFLIGMAGLVCLLFIVIGGVRMMLSGGNPAAITDGKATIWHAVLGFIIVMLSYLIVGYVAGLLMPGGGAGDPLKNLVDFVF